MDATHVGSPFPPTRWTAVVKLRSLGNPTVAQRALADLCRDYWYPLYAFARRFGRSQHDAQDLTQGFFAYAVERNLFAGAAQELGKLRTFLLTAFQRYIGDVREKEHALKRGGGVENFSLNAEEGEARYAAEPADDATPETIFEHTWAMSVLQQALRTLATTETQAGRGAQFRTLEPFLNPAAKVEPDTAAACRALGTSEENVRQLVSRLRKKFRDTLRQHIADTLHDPTEELVDEELLALREALRG